MFCYASGVPRLRPQRHLGSPDQWIPVRAVRLSTQLPVLFVVSDSEGEFFIFILSAMPPVAPCRLRTVIVIRNEWEAEFFAEEGYTCLLYWTIDQQPPHLNLQRYWSTI